ncbi:MAG: isochorismatase family cysteine hydrolase [Candidatus Buchananbacteria bacterium]|jgi:nicotinamidase-related amidase
MKKALVIIDAQKGFINKLTIKTFRRIHNFIERYGKNYELIIFTKYYNHKNSNFVRNLGWRGFMAERETDIADDLKKFINSKNLFIKDTYGSFVDNKLLNLLKKHKINQVELAGFDTENCVLTFARDAFDRGLSVIVLEDLSASHSNPKLHKAAIEIIKDNIGMIK